MNKQNWTPLTAGSHGEFSRSVKDWVETLAKTFADSKCNEDTLPEVRGRFKTQVRNECYSELHYTSIFGSASCTLERLQFHCSGQTAATQRGLTNKDNVQDQQGSAAVATFDEDNAFFDDQNQENAFSENSSTEDETTTSESLTIANGESSDFSVTQDGSKGPTSL